MEQMEGTSKNKKDMDAGVPQYVGGLAEACAKAPRFGRNGRALVLETARKLAEEDDFVFPKKEGASQNPSVKAADNSSCPASEQPPLQPKVEKIRNFDALFEAIPVCERPMIEYNPRLTKIPRIIRQDAIQTLSGKFLAVLLEAIGVGPSKGVEVVSKEGELRKTAMAVALVQEQRIYSKSASKVSYSAEAAKFEANELHVPSECMRGLLASLKTIPETTAGKKRKSEEMGMEDGTERRDRVGHLSSGADGVPMKACFGTSSDESESDTEHTQHQEGSSEGSQLEEDKSDKQVCPSTNIGVPWENCERWLSEAERQLEDHSDRAAPWNRYKKVAKKKARTVQESGQKQLQGSGKSNGTLGSLNASRCGEKMVGPDTGSMDKPLLGNSCAEAGRVCSTPREDGTKSTCEVLEPRERVRNQLDMFVRAELDPLLRAHVITEGVHGMVLKKTLDKVMLCHKGETNADFLIKEGPKIRKLIQQYIGYFRSKEV